MKEPKLRFKADNGTKFPDWKEKRLNDVCEYNKGQSVGINYVGTENMKQDFSGVNDLDSENEVKGVTYNIGDTLMSNIRPYLKKTWKADVKGVCSTDVLVFHPTNINSDYLYRNISSEKFISYVMTAAKGSKMPRGDKEHIMNYDIQVPCLPEQQKIASLFAEIDTLIQSAEKELEGYRELKQGMLQKMFPQKGEKVPELRFPEFTGDWEWHKVGELLEERNEQAPMSDDYPLMAFIANQGVAPKGERYDRSALVSDEAGKKYKRTEFGDFIYSSNNLEAGSIGLNKYGNACISPVYSIFKPAGKTNLDFLGRRFLRKDFINEMIRWRQGAVYGQWKIHETDFMKIGVRIPSVDEQKKIGQYFNSLDNLIMSQQQELDSYKELKKGLLQQMFC